MEGQIELSLRQCYGLPVVEELADGRVRKWHDSILYLQTEGAKRQASENVQQVYGDARAGFLIGDVFKVAVIAGPEVFGLYNLADLRARPEVRRAIQIDPEVEYFMDSSNIWYYGVKHGKLYRFEPDIEELLELGECQTALLELLREHSE